MAASTTASARVRALANRYSGRPLWTHASQVAQEISAREKALRTPPLAYVLALRLRDAGVAPQVVCEYVAVDKESNEGHLSCGRGERDGDPQDLNESAVTFENAANHNDGAVAKPVPAGASVSGTAASSRR